MNEKLISNKVSSEEFILNKEEDDYKNLIIRLKKIRSIISSLEKQLLYKV